MPTRTKSSHRRSRTPKKTTFPKNRLTLVITLLVFLAIGAWGLMRSLAVPSDINLIATDDESATLYKPRIIDENGCYYQDVQCAKAPCEPIKVCLDSSASSTPTTLIPTGCTSWFDGCNTCAVVNGVATACTKKACKTTSPAKPYCLQYSVASPVPTPIPQACVPNPCPPNRQVCKLAPLPEGQVYCPATDPVACTKDAYTCPDGTKVGRTGPKCEFVCPTATPSPSLPPSPILVTLTNFSASSPCGVSHFKSYQFSCSNGVKRTFDTSLCQNLSEAITKAQQACQDPIR